MAIVEIHLKFVEQLNAAVTVIVQVIKHATMQFVSIRAFTITYARRELNVRHKIINQSVNALKVTWEIHTSIVNLCHKLSVLWTLIAHHDWHVLTTSV